MTSIVHDDPATPATAQAIEAFAARFDQGLPAAYRAFLAEHNGGRPEPGTVYLADIEDRVMVDAFFGLGEEELDLVTIDQMNDGRLPEACFSFAKDPFGNEFVLDLEDGSVVYWDCNGDYAEYEGDGDDEDLFEVAVSFEAFLGMLEPAPQEAG
jgi:cell wall assembly regulator SMI1